jgi:hypothetical protein
MVRSIVIGVPPEEMLPETWAEVALSAAAFASARTLLADFDASLFELAEEP